jgi:hypothetical protein
MVMESESDCTQNGQKTYDDANIAEMVIQMAGPITQPLGSLFECHNTVKFARKLGVRSRDGPVHYRRSQSRRTVQRIG